MFLRTRRLCARRCPLPRRPMTEPKRLLHGCSPSRSPVERSSENGSARPYAPACTYIALGSNMGDKIGHIERACREMRAAGLRIRRTSLLYETPPMYVTDQEPFVNGVVEVEPQAALEPPELLSTLKAIENRMGRQKTIDKGPRNIDLDIVLLADRVWDAPDLAVPHRAMLEREFVLRPLCE